MADEYTPTTDEVKLAHAESVTLHEMKEPLLSEANAMFERWKAKVKASAGAEALRKEAKVQVADPHRPGLFKFLHNSTTRERLSRAAAELDQEAPKLPWGNPRTPEEAQHEYYLVSASMHLRYAPQYAEISLNNLNDARSAQASLKARGLKYTVYNRWGEKVRS